MLSKIFKNIGAHPVLFVVVLAVLARLLYWALFPIPDISGGDFPFYDTITRSLIEGGGFMGMQFAPGFSVYLALAYLFFGYGIGSVFVMQIAVSAGIAALTVYLGQMVFGTKTGLWAGIVISVWPLFVIQTFSPESGLLLYTALLLFSIFAYVSALEQVNLKRAALAGGLLAAAALVDPIALYLPVIFLAFLFVVARMRTANRSDVKRVALQYVTFGLVFTVLFSSIVGLWTYRNVHVLDGASTIPIIAKELERNVFEARTIKRLAAYAAPSNWSALVPEFAHGLFVPYNLALLSQNEPLSYKQLLGGGFVSTELSRHQISVLTVKLAITAIHVIMFLLAVFAVLIPMNRLFYYFVMLLVAYASLAPLMVGALSTAGFSGMSTLNSFIFSLVPLLILLAVHAALGLFARRSLRLRDSITAGS